MKYRSFDCRKLKLQRIKRLQYLGSISGSRETTFISFHAPLNEAFSVYLGSESNCTVIERLNPQEYGVLGYEISIYKATKHLFDKGRMVCRITTVRRGCGTGNWGEGVDSFIHRTYEATLGGGKDDEGYRPFYFTSENTLVIDTARFKVDWLLG